MRVEAKKERKNANGSGGARAVFVIHKRKNGSCGVWVRDLEF